MFSNGRWFRPAPPSPDLELSLIHIYLARLFGWRLEQPVLRILLGSVPDWWDVLAYTLGFFLVLLLAGVRRQVGRARQAGGSRIAET